jgi:hypothetical protein
MNLYRTSRRHIPEDSNINIHIYDYIRAYSARVWSSGICGGQSGAGAGFLRELRFPLPIFIPPTSPSS